MRYVLLLRFRRGEGPEEGTPEFDDEMRVWRELEDEMRAAGVYVAAIGLDPDAATTVRASGGEPLVTDGPFAETKEIVFSFFVIDVQDLDAATAWAARMPSVDYGSVEISPLADFRQA